MAAKLAERFWTVQPSGQPYVLRDLDGREVSIEEARQIIAERYAVPEEVRRRRRCAYSRLSHSRRTVARLLIVVRVLGWPPPAPLGAVRPEQCAQR